MRIIGETMYLCPTNGFHVEALSSAWDSLNYVPHSQESKDGFLARALRQNEGFDWTLQRRGIATLTLVDKVTEQPLGYTVIKTIPSEERADFQFTILLPEHRETGRYSEMNILRHKYAYQTSSPVNTTWIRLSASSERQAGTLQSLYSDCESTVDIIGRGTFTHSCITREQWSSWINGESQQQKRESLFVLEE